MTSAHLGLDRMEAATWTLPALHLPAVPRRARTALYGRLAVLTVIVALLAGLAMFARPGPGRAYDPAGAGFKWSAVEPGTGRPVARDEWVSRALAG